MMNQKLSPKPRKKIRLSTLLFLALCVFFFCLFSSLGVWQVQRLQWKNALIEQTQARIHLAATPAPPFRQWGEVTFDSHEYQPVTAQGHFLAGKDVLVTAVTDYGTGYWLMSPLQTDAGGIIFINRGFVPMDWKNGDWKSSPAHQAPPIEQQVTITGLLRMGEGAGFFPRRNDPSADRWYSRQLEAFAARQGLTNVAPFFLDADASMNADGAPIGGLTTVNFTNNHLSYAITWFVMALGVLAAFIFLIIHNREKTR